MFRELYLLLQLRFVLLSGVPTPRNLRIGGAVQDVLPIKGALPKLGPAFGIIIICTGRIRWRIGYVMLEVAKIREEICNSLRASVIYWKRISMFMGIRGSATRLAGCRRLTSVGHYDDSKIVRN